VLVILVAVGAAFWGITTRARVVMPQKAAPTATRITSTTPTIGPADFFVRIYSRLL